MKSDPMLTGSGEGLCDQEEGTAAFSVPIWIGLAENKIETVILTGTKTNCCIRHRHRCPQPDYNVYVVADCVSTKVTVNQVHLEDIRKYLGRVVT